MSTVPPQVSISRVLDAPRHLVYRAFTDPAQLASWWGPNGNSMPLDEIVMDVRTGGFQRWTEVGAGDPTMRTRVSIDLTDVTHEEVLEGVMRVDGSLRGGLRPLTPGSGSRSAMSPEGALASRSTSGSPSTSSNLLCRDGARPSPSSTSHFGSPWPDRCRQPDPKPRLAKPPKEKTTCPS